MARSVKEWKGKTDDAAISPSAKLRIVERQRDRCILCTREFSAKLRPEFDHEIPLALGGEHRERNLRALCGDCHGTKTKADANAIGRARRIAKDRLGIKAQKKPFPGGKGSKWKRKMDGTVVLREDD